MLANIHSSQNYTCAIQNCKLDTYQSKGIRYSKDCAANNHPGNENDKKVAGIDLRGWLLNGTVRCKTCPQERMVIITHNGGSGNDGENCEL